MVSFLSPWFLAGAVAAAVPIVLHLLKRNPEQRVRFAAVKLLKHAPVELTARRRLRELLLLALRVAALVLVAIAFARPYLRSRAGVPSGRVAVVALDTSYSMSAPGRFEQAKQLARQAIDRAPADSRVAVVTFSEAADLVVKPTPDRTLARSAVDRAAVGFGATRYPAAVNAAAQAIGGLRGSIVIVSDLQANGWDGAGEVSVPGDVSIDVVDVGKPPANLAITALGASAQTIIATVRNTGAQPRKTAVRLSVDGRRAGETTVAIGGEQSADVTFGAIRGREAVVTIDDPEGLQADNIRYAVQDEANRQTVLVVTATGDLSRDAFYVHQALTAAEPREFDVIGVAAVQLAVWSDAQMAGRAAVVVLSTRGLERHGRELLSRYVTNGGGMLVAVGPDIDAEIGAGVLGTSSPLRIAPDSADRVGSRTPRGIAPADMRHPIFQTFGATAPSLGLVKFRAIARLTGTAGTGCQELARFTSGEPAMLDCTVGNGRAIVVASDLDNRWNDFPLHATFVPFLNESVRYVSSGQPRQGEYLIGDPQATATQPGFVTVPPAKGGGGAARRVAVNVDPRESDPARMSVDDFRAAVTRLKTVAPSRVRVDAAEEEERQHAWQYVIVMALAALAIEGLVASRTG